MRFEPTFWEVRVSKPAQKSVARAPRPERERLWSALAEMARHPFGGDLGRLQHERAAFRRRVGGWRIFFDVYPERRLVDVVAIRRRTTSTYRGR